MSRNDDERAAGRAECFARLVLAGQQDAHGRSLLDHAERLTERLAMYWEKEVGWLSASLGAERVDETTLMGVGFNSQQVRHATVVKPRAGESPGDYAERIAHYNEPDALAVATAMLEDAAAINPAVPIETTDAARRDAIERLGHAMEQWYEDNQQGKPPPGGGMADGQPTAPGLSAALLRMRDHTRMALLSLDEMSRGPSNRRWGIIERLDARDVIVLLSTQELARLRLSRADSPRGRDKCEPRGPMLMSRTPNDLVAPSRRRPCRRDPEWRRRSWASRCRSRTSPSTRRAAGGTPRR